MKTSFILTLSAAFLASNALCASAQIVSNGDFSANADAFTTFPGYINSSANQSNNPSGIMDWVATGTQVGINGNSTQTGDPFAPSSLANLSGDKNFAFLQYNGSGLRQAIALTAGQTYTLTFEGAARSTDSGASGYAAISDSNSTYVFLAATNADTTNFNLYSTTFTATTADEAITVGNFSPGGDYTFDISDISITPIVPEPSAALVGMLFMGVMGGCHLLRRRCSQASV